MAGLIDGDLCRVLKNDFSTTTDVDSLLSCLAIMSTFKKCSDTSYAMNSCGIRRVHFLGDLGDWMQLLDKAKQLRSFNPDGDCFFEYMTGVLPILEQFVHTYEGKVDNQFWDSVFDLQHTNGASR